MIAEHRAAGHQEVGFKCCQISSVHRVDRFECDLNADWGIEMIALNTS